MPTEPTEETASVAPVKDRAELAIIQSLINQVHAERAHTLEVMQSVARKLIQGDETSARRELTGEIAELLRRGYISPNAKI
jgi:hypothetical protein